MSAGKQKMRVAVSGGRTSLFMAKWLLDNKSDEYEFLFTFANTTAPHPTDTPTPDDTDRWAREAGGIPCGDGTFIAGTVSHTEVARLAYAAGRAIERAAAQIGKEIP
jgi:hypothetical protein